MIVADPGACRRFQRDPFPPARRNLALQVLFASGLAIAPATATRSPEGSIPVFADGFESATLCAWSATVPPSTSTWYLDSDGDSFGDPAAPTESCAAPADHVANADDCDDASAATFPGAAPLDSPTACMLDFDTDDFGGDAPPGGIAPGSDCDDVAAAVNPAADELCNAIDDDCDSAVDEGFDLDNDTWTTCAGDCNDSDPAIHPAAADDPDAAFLDRNCDGIDGDVARAAFVAPSGTDGTGCSLASPCKTVGHGTAVAAADPLRDQVYVRAGTYTEILQPPTGVAIFGGYDAAWLRADRNTPGHTATIQGGYVAAVDAWITVRAASITASFADLVLAGPTALSPGDNSQVVHSLLSTLDFARVTFLQGDGADGGAGGNGSSASATPAATGGDGIDGEEVVVICSTLRLAGGPGASNPACPGSVTDGAAGGSGGGTDTSCPGVGGTCSGSQCNATAGLGGSASSSGAGGGAGGGTCAAAVAGNGTPGAVTDGVAGAAQGAQGFIVANQWRAFSGGAGGVGSHGGGGGGGGGAGGCDSGVSDDRGGGGGGGGAGGCRGSAAGSGGGGGGGSFGIFAIDSTIVVADSLFARGSGGDGGAGGTGGAGQPGGGSGPGGAATPDSGPGGNGGAGSRGGHSGGGAGGSGGASCGVMRFGGALSSLGNSFLGGAGGSGGPGGISPGTNDGATGTAGFLAATRLCASAVGC
ncbi:MAG: putative metal-binding motif-containing protein [Thermoanaerobaculia bacterium]|nr:putative metal-binding motif-containing protein [Thermoanaerobaculia bacterium]